jgi:site-specific DNA-methyltransferase (adenine-specific)
VKPYYEDADVRLFLGDCREVLPRLEAGSVDLLVTDPPYGVSWRSGLRQLAFERMAGDDGAFPLHDALAEALRVLRRGRHVYVFGLVDVGPLPLTSPAELIWDKGQPGPGDLTSSWARTHERILFATHEISKTNREDGYGRLAARLRRGSVLRCPRLNADAVTRHPTEKPVSILRELIEASSLLGETVLDPFAGSGSTLVAAKLEGRKAIGVEVEERYCAVAAERLRQQMLPLAV